MAIETTYTQARENLASYFDRAIDDREVIIVQRRGRRPVAIISADELSSLMETAHLLSSPRNAERLHGALESALRGDGKALSLGELRHEVGIEPIDISGEKNRELRPYHAQERT